MVVATPNLDVVRTTVHQPKVPIMPAVVVHQANTDVVSMVQQKQVVITLKVVPKFHKIFKRVVLNQKSAELVATTLLNGSLIWITVVVPDFGMEDAMVITIGSNQKKNVMEFVSNQKASVRTPPVAFKTLN